MRERTGKDVVSSLGDCEFCWGWSRNWDTGTDGTGQKATCRQAGRQAGQKRGWQGKPWCRGGAKEGKEVRVGAWGGTRTTRAWAGWAGWANVGNRSDWAAEPLRWVPPGPTQLKCPSRPSRPSQPVLTLAPTFCCGLQACRGISDGIRQGQSNLDYQRYSVQYSTMHYLVSAADRCLACYTLHMRTGQDRTPSVVEGCPRLVDPEQVGHFMCRTWVKVAMLLGSDRLEPVVSPSSDGPRPKHPISLSPFFALFTFSCGLIRVQGLIVRCFAR